MVKLSPSSLELVECNAERPEETWRELEDRIDVPSSKYQRIRCDSRTQIVLLSLCHFCSLGMWNALNGLGGLGTGDERLAHYCNTTGYFVGIIAGFVAGGVVNILGMRTAAIIGLVGQGITLFSYYAYYYHHWLPLWLVVTINGVTSIGLSCLTSAIGSGLVHYPTESQRNKFIAANSAILNLGGLVGALIALSMNVYVTDNDEANVALSPISYRVLVIIGCSGILLGLLLCQPERVVRKDRAVCRIPRRKPIDEIRAVSSGVRDTNLLLMVPIFMASVWHEVVLFNFFNSALFNVRSRALNSGWYYMARIVASWVFQKAADAFGPIQYRVYSATATLVVFLLLGAGSALMVFSGFLNLKNETSLDMTEPRTAVLMICFFAYGALETIAASFSFWLLGVLPFGDCNVKNRYVGWYRMFINVGGTISWALDIGHTVPYVFQWLLNTALWVAAAICIQIVVRRTGVNTGDDGSKKEMTCTTERSLPSSSASARK